MEYKVCHLTIREARELERYGKVPDCLNHRHTNSDKANRMVEKPYKNRLGLWMEARWVGITITEAVARFGPEKARELASWMNYKCVTDIEARTWRSLPSGGHSEHGSPRSVSVMQMVKGAGQGARNKPMFPKQEFVETCYAMA